MNESKTVIWIWTITFCQRGAAHISYNTYLWGEKKVHTFKSIQHRL